MSIALSTPVTGGLQTGLTSPTYTVVSDVPPNAHSVQWAVTALGGTQTGVRTHSASDPFTITFERPKSFKGSPIVNSAGQISGVGKNVFKVRVRKGTTPVTGQNPQTTIFELSLSVVAGSDVTDPEDVRAALSLLIGSMSQQSAGIGDTLVSGIL